MSDADNMLETLFALDTPSARDPAFVLEAARRVQKRRFWLELAAGVPWAIAASAILWLLTPWLEIVSKPAADVMAIFLPVTTVVVAVVFLSTPRAGAV